MLTHEQTKKYYDNFGEKQDHQFYENSPIKKLTEFGNFDKANSIFDFGAGARYHLNFEGFSRYLFYVDYNPRIL